MWGRESATLYPPCPIDLYTGLKLSKEDLVVTVGRIAPEKRMELFLEIARKLSDIKFAIIGSVASDKGPYFESLKARSPSNLSIVVSPLRKVKDILGRAKVYVHCARNEHFGITIVEAMSAGVVPIVNDSGGPREIVSEDVGYRWVTTPDAVEQISKVVADDNLRDKFANAAVRRSRLFGPEQFESGIGKVLKELG
jgi:glycosyltransferase involved in cell wall biosynthesis